MPQATTIPQLEDPSVPMFDPLPVATTSQQPAIVTTADVNPAGGSIDSGGPIDRCVWKLTEKQADGAVGRYLANMSALNQRSIATLGVPASIPTVESGLKSAGIFALGAFVGGYHGYKRSGGKGLQTAGYALAGGIFPLITTGVALFQGYGKRRGR